jgi:ATP-dependent protease ClpP protease subunit
MRTNKRRNLNSGQWACIAAEADDLLAVIAEQVEKDSDRDYYMTAEEAKAYGLVDHVVASTRDAVKLAVVPAA